jgi:hypothetical protein
MSLLDPEAVAPVHEGPARRAVILAVAAAVTALLAVLALLLGAWGFDFRRYSQHSGRLQRLLQHQPTLEQVVAALQDEGSPLLAAPDDEPSLRAQAARRGGDKATEVLARGRRWRHTRVFLAGDMVYFIYFDDAGVMRDFVCASR